jgi:glycerophosphoryl diester phosphodiesterase
VKPTSGGTAGRARGGRLAVGAALAGTLLTVLAPAGAATAAGGRLSDACRSTPVVAHRGSVGRAPATGPNENTVRALTAAFRRGADVVETDLMLNRPRHWWLMHDQTVDRTTQGHGLVAHHTDRQMRLLRTADGSRVPSLAAALTAVGGSRHPARHLQLEVKQQPAASGLRRGDLRRLVRRLARVDMLDQVAWASTRVGYLRRLHRAAGGVPVQLIAPGETRPRPGGVPGLVDQVNLHTAAALRRYGGHRTYVAAAHRRGLAVSARAANAPAAWRGLLRAGVDQIVTDRVGAYRQWCRRA